MKQWPRGAECAVDLWPKLILIQLFGHPQLSNGLEWFAQQSGGCPARLGRPVA